MKTKQKEYLGHWIKLGDLLTITLVPSCGQHWNLSKTKHISQPLAKHSHPLLTVFVFVSMLACWLWYLGPIHILKYSLTERGIYRKDTCRAWV